MESLSVSIVVDSLKNLISPLKLVHFLLSLNRGKVGFSSESAGKNESISHTGAQRTRRIHKKRKPFFLWVLSGSSESRLSGMSGREKKTCLPQGRRDAEGGTPQGGQGALDFCETIKVKRRPGFHI